MYSIVQAYRQWRHYILGKETIIHTDHKPLQFMQTQGKLHNDRHQKWSMYLQQFHLNIKYKMGSTNRVIDCLSRPPVVTLTTMLDSCMAMRPMDGPNSMRQTRTSPPPTKCWAQTQLSLISIFRMGCCVMSGPYLCSIK
jgi:hypothetical protein